MRIYTLSHGDITSPVYARVAADASPTPYVDGTTFEPGDLFVIDALTCSPDEVKLGYPAIDAGAAVLLLDADDDHKKALSGSIGFRSHGASRGYHVIRRKDDDGVVRCFISEVGDSTAPASLYCASGTGNKESGNDVVNPLATVYENQPQTTPMTQTDLDFFAKSLTTAAVATTAGSSPPEGLVWYNWVYSRTHTFTASGSYNSDADLGPPPSKTITTYLTYVIQGALNNATQSGAFQYLGLQETGIFQNNGMASNTDTSCGWTLGSICPIFTVPSSLVWYQSSPSNTNNVSTVTTGSSVTVGFNAGNTGGSGNASYTYSNSVTENITDWYITQQTATNWVYGQNTPFDGNTTDPSEINNSRGWNGTIDTSTFPTISTSSLQFAASAVWKTNQVITDEVTISTSNRMRVDYIMVDKVLGFGNAWADWWYQNPPGDSFSIDMSILT
jgi:hypothetical protein